MRTLAANSPKRAAALPNVPTMSEAGLVDGEYPNWFGVSLPVKTSRHIVNGLYDETLKALREPNVKSMLAALGGDPLVMTPTEFDEHVKAEIAIDAMLVKIAGIKPNYASRRFMCKKQQIKARKLKLSAERTVYRHLMLRENIGSFAEAKNQGAFLASTGG